MPENKKRKNKTRYDRLEWKFFESILGNSYNNKIKCKNEITIVPSKLSQICLSNDGGDPGIPGGEKKDSLIRMVLLHFEAAVCENKCCYELYSTNNSKSGRD